MIATPMQRLEELGIELPAVVPPLAAYMPAVRVGDVVWVSGQLPMADGVLVATGYVSAGPDAGNLGFGGVSVEQATRAARQCAINALAALASAVDGLDNVRQIVKVTGYVACKSDFTGQPSVINGASELIGSVFGPAGVHARSAVGVSSLPLGSPVEIDLVALAKPAPGQSPTRGLRG